jgi:hypothetical protein
MPGRNGFADRELPPVLFYPSTSILHVIAMPESPSLRSKSEAI